MRRLARGPRWTPRSPVATPLTSGSRSSEASPLHGRPDGRSILKSGVKSDVPCVLALLELCVPRAPPARPSGLASGGAPTNRSSLGARSGPVQTPLNCYIPRLQIERETSWRTVDQSSLRGSRISMVSCVA